jgi:hypothetical protein
LREVRSTLGILYIKLGCLLFFLNVNAVLLALRDQLLVNGWFLG